ncbi:MAG: 2-oxoacid:acceptor oxidoreductase subunit alpha [Candidatus Omnitrophota bacterium]|jgi:2-oxoglutarate ferredoxin oxidoreductase subunit alpha
MEKESGLSVLIGGKAGFGIDKSGVIIARILSELGYRIYIYRDYPSIIRGGHTFSIIRASRDKVATHQDRVDFLLALDQDTFNLHKDKLKKECFFIYDPEEVKIEGVSACGTAIETGRILKEEGAPEIMRNTCIIGAFCRSAGIGFKILEDILRRELPKEIDLNLKVAHRGFEEAKELLKVEVTGLQKLPLLSGNQAVALGLIRGGLNTYIAYPMTPASPILHFLADIAGDFNLKVIHPESEVGVMLMATGFSYMGEKVAVGTSGGGFCLMAEGLSFAGMAELPVVIVLGQRPGPSTGLPTYSSQTELHFALNAGQGDFLRFVVAPGDPQEAYYWSSVALNISWKYQIPSIILTDKNLGEGIFNFDISSVETIKDESLPLWNKSAPYKRYLNTENGVSPLAFAPEKGAVIKANSYEHDESGITTEDPVITRAMQDKRLRKEEYLSKDMKGYETVKVYGDESSRTALLCWGSNKGVCVEAAQRLGLKVIQPLVFSPFPSDKFAKALTGVKRLISVEDNATGQLAKLIRNYGFKAEDKILKYDGRPFTPDGLEEELRRLMR